MNKYFSIVEEFFSLDGQSEFRESEHFGTFEMAAKKLNDLVHEIVTEIATQTIMRDGETVYLNAEGEEIAADYDGDHDCAIRMWEGSEDVEGDRDYMTIANLDILCWTGA